MAKNDYALALPLGKGGNSITVRRTSGGDCYIPIVFFSNMCIKIEVSVVSPMERHSHILSRQSMVSFFIAHVEPEPHKRNNLIDI